MRQIPPIHHRPRPAAGARRPSPGPAATHPDPTPGGWLTAIRTPGGTLALVGASMANLIMVAVMTVIPLHLVSHGGHLGTVGLLLSLHIVGMFAPSPLSGWLCDRLGSRAILGLGGILLAVATAAAAGDPDGSLLAATILLGIGWKLAHVAASALLVESTTTETRLQAQGVTETAGASPP